MGLFRFFYTSARFQNVNKGSLALLRKKTGFSLGNIRKALEMHNNDINKAEEWLKEQAKALGWTAANKLQNRAATQGLVGIAIDKKKLAMVELNCETDFVSRNEKFKSLVELVAKTCLQQPVLNSGEDTNKINFNSEELGKLKANNDCLADHLALSIGSMGENMALRRGFCYETKREDINIAFGVHPPAKDSEVLLGKYGSFIAFLTSPEQQKNVKESEAIANQICNHIIGMSPTKIGEFTQEDSSEYIKNMENMEDEEEIEITENSENTENTESPKKPRKPENKKKALELVHQSFLFDSSVPVGQVLKEAGITILDFKRFECGEVEDEEEVPSGRQEENEKNVNAATG